MKQKTLKKDLIFKGIGVHFGVESSIVLKPAPENSGICFIDSSNFEKTIKIGTIVPQEAMHATVLNNGNFVISTVEHLMAAIIALEIDNLIILINGPEIPILDGSALTFVDMILQNGLQEQNQEKNFLTPINNLRFEDDQERTLEIFPANFDTKIGQYDKNFYFDYFADFTHPLVGKSSLEGVLSKEYFVQNIAPARTFGFLEQLPFLRRHGLAKGTTLGNTVVLGKEEFLNETRFHDEFSRHKLIDLIGDLALLGKNLAGTVKAQKTGHSFNRLVVKHYIEHPELWKLI
ncbi:UDP-3-O-acyl-N-acetylglucosamine deacetylase [Candidatus Babeliales bacterium]|nr:UDP-3-O-acyl-N-acetylglucosamine deacetylase [Candidatus Babeliales bacterium]